MSRWVKPWVLVVACAPLACGNTDENPPSVPWAAAGASGAGGAGSAGATGAAPALVDPIVSAAYSWAECGRIEPSSRPVAALYTPDESVIEIEENGRVRLFPSGSVVGVTLVPAQADRLGGGALLSADGRWLLLADAPNTLGIYAADDGNALGAATKSITRVTSLPTAEENPGECDWVLGFSSDSQQLLRGSPESLCIAEIEGGTVLTTVAVAPAEGALASALLADSPAPLRAFRNGRLTRYGRDGTLVDDRDVLAGSVPAGQVTDALFAPDARHLLLAFLPDDLTAGGTGLLIAIDSESGAELWRTPFVPDYESLIIATDSSVVQIRGRATLRLSDGQQVGSDPDSFFSSLAALGPGGRRELRVSETLIEWDMSSGKLLQLYGSHIEGIRDLDISRDGRFLASHGDRAIVWRVDDDFARSTPLFDGAAPDDSWNVALAVDGSILAVSGDNVAFFKSDGSWASGGVPPATVGALDCLSADWSFSPLGSWVAGTHYGSEVVLFETPGLEAKDVLQTSNCRGGVAFSPDGSKMVTASLELFDTTTWSRLWTTPPVKLVGGAEHGVQFAPDGSEFVVTRCEHQSTTRTCRSERRRTADGTWLGALPGLTGQRARYSPEGHWVMSGNDLWHLPTGHFVGDAFADGEALFAPNGDVIAGEPDGSLVRYCRSSR